MKAWIAIAGIGLLTAGALRDETIAQALAARFDGDYLLLSVRTRQVVASKWDHSAKAAPVGSLVKPFLALAFAGSHGFRYPTHVCKSCWLPRGHGSQDVTQAVAHSCNSYFTELGAATAASDVDAVAERYGLPRPSEHSAEAYIGARGLWRATPVQIALAYVELFQRGGEPGVRPLLAGMAASARAGTASAIGAGALAKTGTAKCEHSRRAPGDGYVVALFPESAPEYALVVRAHGAPGSAAAKTASEMIRFLTKGR